MQPAFLPARCRRDDNATNESRGIMTSQHRTLPISTLMQTSGVGFGTSGARGLVTAMTDEVCYAYTLAFLQHLRDSGQLGGAMRVALAGDMRDSTGRILEAAASAVADFGLQPEYCGRIPSPAVASYGMAEGIPSLMVTGSHIPDDRNGIKFNTAKGEILKHDETGIRAQQVVLPEKLFGADGHFAAGRAPRLPAYNDAALRAYVQRYTGFFPPRCLAGKRLGLYQHSSVAREVFAEILSALGAQVIKLGYSDRFIPVDTEAIRPEDVELAAAWSAEHGLDALISADGDADRPLISDERGHWLRGDVAGILCSRYLGADVVVTPVSSNSAVERCGWFKKVLRTRIGSPFVVASMQEALFGPKATVVGYEANGGFLTATDVTIAARTLTALPTRDAMLVPLAILALAAGQNCRVSELVAMLPPRFTASNRVEHFPTELSRSKLAELCSGDARQDKLAVEAVFKELFGEVASLDDTDGLRITFTNGDVVHLRPSGNAPEFRCYNEADSPQRAAEMNTRCMALIETWKPR